MARYFVDYNHASAANTILWTHEKIKITETETFIDYIRCDFDGGIINIYITTKKILKMLRLLILRQYLGMKQIHFYYVT